MKIRTNFVTNSSSTSFIIVNKTDKNKTVADFLKENFQLVKQYNDEYGLSEGYTEGEVLQSAEQDEKGVIIHPGENEIIFGDEDGTVIGIMFDYILRDGGNSTSFSWKVKEYLR